MPAENIKEFSTEEHPGLATIYEAGKGVDIKGILKQPIKIGDYRLPWEFQTSLVQSFNLLAGVGAKTQINAAIGLNVAVTFSDPSTWPLDRDEAASANARVSAPGRPSWLHRGSRRGLTPIFHRAASGNVSRVGAW